MTEQLYHVAVELQEQANNTWTATVTDTVDPSGMILLENTVDGATRTLVLQHQESGGANPFTTAPYQRQPGENLVVALVDSGSGVRTGQGSKGYE